MGIGTHGPSAGSTATQASRSPQRAGEVLRNEAIMESASATGGVTLDDED